MLDAWGFCPAEVADQLGPTGLSNRNEKSAATINSNLGPVGRSRRTKKAWESGKRETVVEPITPRGTKEHPLCGICSAEHLKRGYCQRCYNKKYSQARAAKKKK